MSWTAGYVVDVDYTYGYHGELSPDRLKFACLAAGILPPEGDDLSYLELGFGQGISINIHAAACPGEFWGNDFNPRQAAHAQALATASGSGATLLDDSFAELAARPDLPDFDVIVLHGIWTWISDENGRIIVDLIRRKLRVGGILYVGYNCLPGLAPLMPLRQLLRLHATIEQPEARGLMDRINPALDFADEVASAGAMYFRSYPQVAAEIKRLLQDDNRHYLAHEYFNEHWRVMFFSDLVRWLEPTKVTYGTTAVLLDQIEGLSLSPEGAKLLAGIGDPVLRESVRDYLVDQKFRRDIFVKGRRDLSAFEQFERLAAQLVVLTVPAALVPSEVNANGRKTALNDAVLRPIVAALAADDQAPKQLGELLGKLAPGGMSWAQLFQMIVILMGLGCVQVARQPSEAARRRCAGLNRFICHSARKGQVEFLASPVIGSGVRVPRFIQLFLLADQQGRKSAAERASFVWNLLAQQGEQLVKDGRPLETAEDNLAELTELAGNFARDSLPQLRLLGIA